VSAVLRRLREEREAFGAHRSALIVPCWSSCFSASSNSPGISSTNSWLAWLYHLKDSEEIIAGIISWFAVPLIVLMALEAPSAPVRISQKFGADIVTGWLGQLVFLSLFVDGLKGALPRAAMLIPILFFFARVTTSRFGNRASASNSSRMN
jgi:hypothetical protein